MNIRAAQASKAVKSLAKDGFDAVYREASGSFSVSVRVLRGKSLLRLSDRIGGTKTELWDNDFFVRVADLVNGVTPIEPKHGSRLDVTEDDGHVRRYELLSPGVGEPHARKVENNLWWRLHTKFYELVS